MILKLTQYSETTIVPGDYKRPYSVSQADKFVFYFYCYVPDFQIAIESA